MMGAPKEMPEQKRKDLQASRQYLEKLPLTDPVKQGLQTIDATLFENPLQIGEIIKNVETLIKKADQALKKDLKPEHLSFIGRTINVADSLLCDTIIIRTNEVTDKQRDKLFELWFKVSAQKAIIADQIEELQENK